MSSAPFPALLNDLRRWGYDVARNGTVYTATLLGGDPITFRRTDTNAALRAAHERAATESGHRLNGSTGKKARARQRRRYELDRIDTADSIADIERQIEAQRDRDQVRRLVLNRMRELRQIEDLMRA